MTRLVAIERFLDHWGPLLEFTGGAGWILLALLAATFFAVGFAIVGGPRARGRARALVMAPAALLMPFSLGSLAFFVMAQRAVAPAWAMQQYPLTPFPVMPPWLGEDRGLFLLMLVSAVALPGALFAFARVASTRPARAALRGLALVALSTGGVSAWVLHAKRLGLEACQYGWVRPGLVIRTAFAELTEVLDLAVLAPVAVAALALVFVLARRLRTGEPIVRTWAGAAGALSVFVLGLSAFALTRGHATDRHHPLNLALAADSTHRRIDAPTWVDRARCGKRTILPTVELLGSVMRLDGYSVVNDLELIDRLETIGRNWRVLHPGEPFPREVRLFVAPSAPQDGLRRVLKLVAEAGIRRARFVLAVPEPLRSETLGTIEVRRHCELPVRLEYYGPGSFEHPEIELPQSRTVEVLLHQVHDGKRTAIAVPAPWGYQE